MKKFEETVIKNDGGFFAVHKNGKTTYEIQGLTSSPLIIFGDWVSPEGHQKVVEALVNTTDKLDCAEERVELLEKTVDQLKSQLEKQQPEIPEVPQFVADWYEENKDNLEITVFSINIDTSRIYVGDGSNIKNWFSSIQNKPIETIFAMKNGYTVAKEKRFYLKNKSVLIFDPDSDDSDVEELYLGAGGNFVPYQHLAKIFTQSQIDSMETGSYEQIEVEE